MLIPTNGTQLHVDSFDRNGAPVIFLHFGGGHSGIWNRVIPYFRSDYWVVTIDLRGHGRSEKPVGGYTIGNMALDILGIMDYLGIERARFVGSSMGAEVALRLAAEYPARVVSLVLEQAFQNTFGPHGVHAVPDAEIPAKVAALLAERAARPELAADTPEGALAVLLDRWGRPGASGAFAEGLRGCIGPLPDGRYGMLTPPGAITAYMQDCWLTRFERDFARVRCPVLFLPDERSLQDAEVQASMAWFRSLLAESHVTLIPGAEHAFVWLDHPDEGARGIRTFFGAEKSAGALTYLAT